MNHHRKKFSQRILGSRRADLSTWLVLLLASSSSVACQQADNSTNRADTSTTGAVTEPLDSIFLTSNSGIRTAERAVIRDSVSWARMRARLQEMQPFARLPEVDFDSSLIVVAASGSPSSGQSIRIDSAKVRGADMMIYIRKTIRESCGPSDLMEAYSAHAVRVRRAAGAVTFVNDSTVWKCP